MFDPAMEEALKRLSDRFAEEHPDIAALIARLQAGDLDEAEGMGELIGLVQEHGLSKRFEQIAMEVFQPLREGEIVPVELGPAPGAIYAASTDTLRQNPLREAAILERVQFDGDVPELRTGPMDARVKPAVPVNTTATNPVAIGLMMDQASDEVAAQLDQANREHEETAKQIAADVEAMDLDDSTALQTYQEMLPAAPTGVPGYEAGKVPEARQVPEPTGSALVALTPEERQQAAYKVLATTQGRRSAVHAITELVLTGLEGEGFKMDARDPSGATEVQVYAEWTTTLGGQGENQSNFSFITLASAVLLRKLVPQLQKTPVEDPVLEVMAINAVDVRQVGWAARVVTR